MRVPDPGAGVRGANVSSTIAAFGFLPEVGKTLLRRHGIAIESLTPSHIVPLQAWLDVLSELESMLGPEAVHAIGRRVVEKIELPPELDTVEKMLRLLDVVYHANHVGEVGHYVVSEPEPSVIVVRCETPYPPQLELGLIEGFANDRRLAGRKRYTVEYASPTDASHSCTLIVRRR